MGSFPWPPRLDRRACVTGVYNAEEAWTTFTLPFVDGTINRIVLGSDFGANAGEIITPDWIAANVLYVYDRDLSAGSVVVGREYPASVELTRPYIRGRDDKADVNASVTNRQLVASYFETVGLEVAAAHDRRTTVRRRSFAKNARETGTLTGWFQGDAGAMRLFIMGLTPRPMTVTAVEHVVDYEPRMSNE